MQSPKSVDLRTLSWQLDICDSENCLKGIGCCAFMNLYKQMLKDNPKELSQFTLGGYGRCRVAYSYNATQVMCGDALFSVVVLIHSWEKK